jgi:hypothetical protein
VCVIPSECAAWSAGMPRRVLCRGRTGMRISEAHAGQTARPAASAALRLSYWRCAAGPLSFQSCESALPRELLHALDACTRR